MVQRNVADIDALLDASDALTVLLGGNNSQQSTCTDDDFTEKQKAILQELMKQFGMAIGRELGQQLTRVTEKVDAQISTLNSLTRVQQAKTQPLDPSFNQSADTAACAQKVTSSMELLRRSRKNNARNLRRKACRAKHVFQRDALLRLMPGSVLQQASSLAYTCSQSEDANEKTTKQIVKLHECLFCNDNAKPSAHITEADIIPIFSINHMRTGLGTGVLESQCRSVRFLQSWWRFKTYAFGARKAHASLWTGTMNYSTNLSCANALQQRSSGSPCGTSPSAKLPSNLAGRVKRSIEVTLDVDGHKWTQERLVTYSKSFIEIARNLSGLYADALGIKLRSAYFHRIGRAGFGTDMPDIDEEQLHNAAMFYIAIGSLQP